MEERLTEIGDWLRPQGECIYGTHALERTRQWSKGTVPQMEQKEFRAEYDITQLVDSPPSGFARVDAFFTAKDDAVYAILPRWPEQAIALDGFEAPSGATVTLLETGTPLRWHAEGKRLHIDVPASLRASIPFRNAYVLKMAGVKAL